MINTLLVSWLKGKYPRYVLTPDQAREIYALNFLASTSSSTPNMLGQTEISSSVILAAQYSVSSKTIRDIWNRKTWTHATKQMFDQEHMNHVSFANIEYLNLKVRS